MHLRVDCLIIGSGFSGSLCALVLKQLGFTAAVIDKAHHPRFAIGESSTPIADMILRDLAASYGLDKLAPLSAYGPWCDAYPELGVGPKRGFSYFFHQPNQPFQPTDDHRNRLLVAASSSPYWCDTHWHRADVDAFLAQCVREADIPFLEGFELSHMRQNIPWVFEGLHEGLHCKISATFVLDASGAGGVLPNFLRLQETRDSMQTASTATYTHFANLPRWDDVLNTLGGRTDEHPFPSDDAALHHVLNDGWLWMLRFRNGITSVGLLTDHHRSAGPYGLTTWEMMLKRYPTLHALFGKAEIHTPPGQFFHSGRLQRGWAQAAGTDWALLPHTAGFVDPLHSTGIAHTLSGVERMMSLFAQHGLSGDFTQGLQTYSQAIYAERQLIDGLVSLCYTSLDHPKLFMASTMVYFATVVHYEQRRVQHAGRSAFLHATDPEIAALPTKAHTLLSTTDPRNPTSVADFAEQIEALIQPWNTVGLFHPPAPNMYHHTAARG